MTLVQDSHLTGRRQIIAFLSMLYEESVKFSGLLNQRGFAELCARVRREQRDAEMFEDLDTGRQVVGFVQHLVGYYSEKAEPRAFLERYLYGKPVFHFEIEGDEADILAYNNDDF